ncbi:hypothetical protein BB561_000865 [Smittium simulii]|uniref:Uncharacterized protein n=1 Tax=Smittium simulii TaxID=133385 RepID=A0A2T9YXA2_9FUNG|nr:hypothetical protein BB561_000865 [Smittium simulii]
MEIPRYTNGRRKMKFDFLANIAHLRLGTNSEVIGSFMSAIILEITNKTKHAAQPLIFEPDINPGYTKLFS